jgi:uncharacterized protein (TIGR00369 family)
MDNTPPRVRPGHDGPHIWNTLGYQRLREDPGAVTIGWEASADYSFPSTAGPVIQGGLVTAVLDAAMGGAAWTVLDGTQSFLTGDLRVEFLRATRPGPLQARGTVVRRTRAVVFCAAELFDAQERLLASSRCTQIVLAATTE